MDYTTSTYASPEPLTASQSAAMASFFVVYFAFILVLAVIAAVALWKIFKKAGKPGWAAIVPIYNMYVLLEIVGRPGWWLLLFLVPFANMVISVIIALDLAKAFGKSQTFGIVALWLFSFVGYLMLGFGKDQYLGSTAGTGTVVPPAGPATPPTPTPPAPPVAPPTAPAA